MTASVAPATPFTRNPGPSWGLGFLRVADRIVPEWLYRPVRAIGTWIAIANMPGQRRHSRDYLRVVLGREPSWRDVFRHFFAFEESLMLKLRVSNGLAHRGVLTREADDFRTHLRSGETAFLGSFHIADSDLTGFLLGGQEKLRVALIRQRVGNSQDVERLGAQFGDWISFIWVNTDENPLIAIKEAIASGRSVALKCDRLEFCSKTEAFRFLGARRLFPFTIYHLALIFQRPVLLSVGIPAGEGETRVHASPSWSPDPALSRDENLARAHHHFQAFLEQIESLLRENPYWWFNFIPLNPEVADA